MTFHVQRPQIQGFQGPRGNPGCDFNMHTPEENADSGSACEGVRRACAHIVALQLGLTAVALRAQHGTAHQTQRGSARLIAA